jgi:hypothetical protein
MALCVESYLPVRGMQTETTRTLRGHRGGAHDNTFSDPPGTERLNWILSNSTLVNLACSWYIRRIIQIPLANWHAVCG